MKDSVEQKRETKKDVKYINDTHYRFDGAIAREYGIEVPAHALCNTKKRTERRPQLSYPGTNIKAVEPSLRSPYSVMQYFGRLLASDLIHRVKLIDVCIRTALRRKTRKRFRDELPGMRPGTDDIVEDH